MGEHKQIFTVSLESTKRAKAYAIYDGTRLAVTHCLSIAGPPSEWKDKLLEEIAEKVRKGFVVLVEDRTGVFCQEATQFSFEEVVDDRTTLYAALDWWASMQSMGNIILDSDVERYNIRVGGEGGLVDRQQDEKGRTTYNVDWQKFNGGHKALLMCMAGAMIEPLSERFLRAMFECDGGMVASEADPLRTIESIAAYEAQRFRELDKANT